MPFHDLPQSLRNIAPFLESSQWVISWNTLMPDETLRYNADPSGRQFLVLEYYPSLPLRIDRGHEGGSLIFEKLATQTIPDEYPNLSALALIDVTINPLASAPAQEQAAALLRPLGAHWAQSTCIGLWQTSDHLCLDDISGRWTFVLNKQAQDSTNSANRPLYTLRTYVSGGELC